MASTRLSAWLLSAFLIVLGACAPKKEPPQVYLLTGLCKIEVSTPHEHAEILVDGILVGHARVTTNVPCGQKQVRVKLHGYKSFEGIFTADASKTLLVPIKLEPMRKTEVYALGDKVLEDIRAGKLAKGAVEGGASAPAAAAGEAGDGGAAADAAIDWNDWT